MIDLKIIVVGIGKVGQTVAEQLALEEHDVTVVDTDPDAVNDAVQSADVIGVIGNGAVQRTLQEAGVADCDLVIALTGSDEVNLLCCLMAQKTGGARTIARIRNPEYTGQIGLIQDSLGLARAINPEKEAAAEIQRILKMPVARNADMFSMGKVELISFIVDENCLLCGKSLSESFAHIKARALLCAVERGSELTIPDGNFVVQKGDVAAVLIPTAEVPDFFRQIGFRTSNVRNIMIIGGGKIAYYLVKSLLRLNVSVTIIERNREIAEKLSLEFPKANIIHGDGTNRSLLLEEGLTHMDALCSLTGIDEENIVLSLFAKSVAPQVKTVTKVNRTAFQEVIRAIDVGSVVYPKYTTANLILQYVRANSKRGGNGGDVQKLARIINNRAEAIEFSVAEGSRVIGKTLTDLELKKGILIGSIIRDGKAFIPRGSDAIHAGDSVIVVTITQRLTEIDDILKD